MCFFFFATRTTLGLTATLASATWASPSAIGGLAFYLAAFGSDDENPDTFNNFRHPGKWSCCSV